MLQKLSGLCKTPAVVALILLFAVSLSLADGYATAIEKGLDYLRKTQDETTGIWPGRYPIGIAGLAALAFLNQGIGESDPQVAATIKYIISQQGEDGRFGDPPGYVTAIAITALKATGNHAYDEVIRKAKDYYVNNQNADGGWRYNPSYTTSDHSVHQWGVLGLYEAYEFLGLPRNDTTWENARRYLTTTQNDDGGWGYELGGSYGSMTAAGMWSSFYCGIPSSDSGTQKALNWIANNYTWDGNPGKGSWLRYYQYTMAKALTLNGKRAVVDANGVSHDWYKELSTKLLAEQQDDGRWTGGEWGYEGDELVTAYVLLILELGSWPQGSYSVTVEVESKHSDLYVFDPTGLQTSRYTNEIDEATFSAGPPQKVTLNKSAEDSRGIMAGRYYLEFKAPEDDVYTLTITGTKTDADTGQTTTFFGPKSWTDVKIDKNNTQCLALNMNLIAGVDIVVTDDPHPNPLMELLPGLIELSVKPDDVIQRKLIIKEVSNELDLDNVVLSASDLVVKGQAGEVIPAQNITFDLSRLSVPAGGEQEIIMEITVPSNILPNLYYSGYITAESDDAGTKRAAVNIINLATSELQITDLCNIPNPFSGTTAFSYYLTQDATDVYIEIFSVSGEMIKKIDNALGNTLFNEVSWDGTLESGEQIANGVYVYRVTATDGNETVDAIEKMAVMR